MKIRTPVNEKEVTGSNLMDKLRYSQAAYAITLFCRSSSPAPRIITTSFSISNSLHALFIALPLFLTRDKKPLVVISKLSVKVDQIQQHTPINLWKGKEASDLMR